MKFIVLIGDGMGDYPISELDGKTVLEEAQTPFMDAVAWEGRGGLAQTIPPSMQPGSDVANMEILGYDTTRNFTGRAVFEALSMGHHLEHDDVAFRTNFVTLEDNLMRDYSAGHITTEEASELIKLLDEKIGSKSIRFYPGISYRHLMIWKGGIETMETTPPHDIIGKEYKPYLPRGKGAEELLKIMNESSEILSDTLINRKRAASGKLKATSIWLWGQGKNLEIETIEEKFGLKGCVISAVDLIKGIGVAAGLKPVFVPGATGYVDTNYRGKAEAALDSLDSTDFVFLHVEAPDEAGHNGDIALKIQAIEDFDKKIVGTIYEEAKRRGDTAILVTCDHRTPIVKRTHTREPVPFAFTGPGVKRDAMTIFSEKEAGNGEIQDIPGHDLLKIFIGDFINK